MLIIAIALGAIFGAGLGEGSGAGLGALVGGLLVWLLVALQRQQRRIAALEAALQDRLIGAQIESARKAPQPASASEPHARAEAEGQVADAPAVRPPHAAPTPTTRAPQPVLPQPAAPMASMSSARPPGAPVPASAAMAASVPGRSAPIRTAATSRGLLDPLIAWLFGGNTIVKAGIGILFIGLAFLAKYATEHVHVPVELRLAGIGAVALVLLGVGWRLRSRRPGYAQVLQGGAIAVLYLTLFVAFRFFGVLAVGPVFALMALVAALAAALAVLQDARALAIIAALGGFAAPLLVSTGAGNQVALFAYYLVLDLGIAAVAWHKTWRALNLIGFAFTFVVGAAWGVMRYRPEDYASSQFFLIVFFLLFNAILLMPSRRAGSAATTPAAPVHRPDTWVNGSLLFGLPAITFVLQHGLVRHTEYGTAFAALVLAGFYVLLGRFVRSRQALAPLFDASLAIAIVFLALVIPFALDSRSVGGTWALEGAGLVWLGLRQARRVPRVFGYGLLVLAGLVMLGTIGQGGVPTSVFNAWLFNALLLVAAALATAYFVHRRLLRTSDATTAPLTASDAPAAPLMASEALAEPLAVGYAVAWAIVAASVQIDALVPAGHALAAWLASLSAIALVCTALATRLAWPCVARPAAGHAPLLALGAAATAALLASPAGNGGWWAWPLALATHLVVLRWAAVFWPSAVQHAVHALGLLVLAALGALQGRAITAGWGDDASAWAWLGWLAAPALLLLLLLRPAAARPWPVRAMPVAYRTSAAAVLTAGLLVWTLLANSASDGTSRPLPYLPLLNPLDIGVGVALLAAWRWLTGEPAREVLAPAPPWLAAALVGTAGFVWLNAMLIRGFHHFGGVPFRLDAWTHSLAVQTGLALLWSVTALALMGLAARRAARLPWMVGAALLAAVVLKLLLVDLSGTGTVTRIVSFIGVGVLMLVIGYVAPLPSAADSREAGHAG